MTEAQKILIIIVVYLLIGFAVTGFQKELEELKRPKGYMVIL